MNSVNFKKIYIMGDVHGDFMSTLSYQLGSSDLNECLIIQIGDFGLGFDHKKEDEGTLKFINRELGKKGCTCYVIRGNHDDPSFFDGTYNFSNLRLLKDYSTIQINGENFLFVGGAVSIDRTFRINRDEKKVMKTYFEGEEFNLDLEKIKKIKCDVLVTHTTPTWCHPINDNGFGPLVESFIKYDKKLIDDLRKERSDMDILFGELNKSNKIHTHYYGHFHESAEIFKDTCKHFLINQYNCTEYKKG